MRNDQPHKADDACKGNCSSCDKRGRYDDDDFGALHIQAHLNRLVVAELQKVQGMTAEC